MPKFVLVQGDITRQDADAIVNAANTALLPGGGVDGAITRAAGPDALAERQRIVRERGKPALPTGEAVATGGGLLKARWIIHTAGPVYWGALATPSSWLDVTFRASPSPTSWARPRWRSPRSPPASTAIRHKRLRRWRYRP
jgi:O-acetyl-ADP-ribose deacetylase (regulator of RNase III)